MQVCWNKLPLFRDVTDKLHKSFDEAVRLIYVPHNPIYRHKSLTSTSVKKSNKKRSSVQPANGPSRLSASALPLNRNSNINNSNNNKLHPYAPNSLTTDTANLIGSRRKSSKRETDSSGDKCEECYRSSVDVNNTIATGVTNMAATTLAHGEHGTGLDDSNTNRDFNSSTIQSSNRTVVKRRPVARSIGFSAPTVTIRALDLLYYEESPDFCVPIERYNIKGTKGRLCSENADSPNNCERLCCGRGYKTEVREEKYDCECQFRFCCDYICKTCKGRKVIHKCLWEHPEKLNCVPMKWYIVIHTTCQIYIALQVYSWRSTDLWTTRWWNNYTFKFNDKNQQQTSLAIFRTSNHSNLASFPH